MSENQGLRVSDNATRSRYELLLDGSVVGSITYQHQPGAVVLIHTEIDPAFEGRAFGSRLVEGALDEIQAEGLAVVPVCPFVTSYLRRHPEYRDLVARDPATRP